jgi:hypothetical protein
VHDAFLQTKLFESQLCKLGNKCINVSFVNEIGKKNKRGVMGSAYLAPLDIGGENWSTNIQANRPVTRFLITHNRPLPELLLRYRWGFRYLFIIIIKINNICFCKILLQDKYNIGVLTVNIEFM